VFSTPLPSPFSRMTTRNTYACVPRARARARAIIHSQSPEGLFAAARKNRTRKLPPGRREISRESFDDRLFPPPRLPSVTHFARALYEARKIRCLVRETCPGRGSVLAAKLGLSCLIVLSPSVPSTPTSFRGTSLLCHHCRRHRKLASLIRQLRELPESRDANLTCTTTNDGKKKGI